MEEVAEGFEDLDFAEEDLGEDSYAPAPPPSLESRHRSHASSTPAEVQREREKRGRGARAAATVEPGDDPFEQEPPERDPFEQEPAVQPEPAESDGERRRSEPRARESRGGGPRRMSAGRAGGTSALAVAISIAALATFVVSIVFTKFGSVRWGNFMFFLLFFIIASLLELRFKGGGTLNLGFAPLLGAMVSLPVALPALAFGKITAAGAVQVVWVFFLGTIVVAGLRMLLKSGKAKSSLEYALSLLLQYTAVGLASLVYFAVIKIAPKKPELFGKYTPAVLVAAALAAGILYLAYLASESMIVSAEGHFPMGVYLQSIMRKSVLPFGVLAFSGVFIGLVYANVGEDVAGLIWALIIVVPLLLVVVYAYNMVAATDQYLLETIKVLSAIPEETGMLLKGHAERVAELATGVARELGLGPEDTMQVEFAAYLHDIGAITRQGQAPEQRQLTEAEGVISGGVDIVGKVDYLEVAAEILGGREGLRDRVSDVEKRRAVSLGAGILKAVDDFESLVNGSEEKEPLTESEALTEMNLERGVKYDSKVLRAIARVLARMPRELPSIAEGSPESSPFWGDQEG